MNTEDRIEARDRLSPPRLETDDLCSVCKRTPPAGAVCKRPDCPRLSPPPSSDGAEAELRRLLEKLPALPWELWTSNSYRRVHQVGGPEILGAYRQRSDGHPDLSMPQDQLQALVAAVNALPALLSSKEALERENERLKPYEEELRKLAEDLGEADDPFAAWESLHLLETRASTAEAQLAEAREAIERLIPTNLGSPPASVPDSMVLPCDITVGEIREARAFLSKLSAKDPAEGGER